MSYVVLARKYRPQTFEDLVGQIPVSQTLLNALQSGRIAHAYVFSGPRGIGKTTTARLLAKCLNCEKGISIKPCNQCPSCVSIAQGSSVQDVLEIDGASNRGIEQIRELRESVKYTPSSSRYRIYIIDEAHQITKDAFGALLKTLEEPPAHVIFMMATTEVQKIPAPILSRCQRFSLRPISPDLVLKHLKEICLKEKIKVEESALADIVRFVEGSLRDALSLLDQALVFSPQGITSETLRQLLGLLPRDVIRNTASVLNLSDPIPILKLISQSVQDGIDLTQLGKDLQDYYHTLLLIKAGVEDVFQTDLKALQKDAEAYDFPKLERNIRLLSRALEEMRRSESPRAIFEIYLLKIGQKTMDPRILIEKIEHLQKGSPIVSQIPFKTEVKTANPSNFPPPKNIEKSPVEKQIQPEPNRKIETPPSKIEPKANPVASTLTEASVRAAWPNFINAVAEQKMPLASTMDEAVIEYQNNVLSMIFEKAFSQQLVIRSLNFLKPLILQHLGEGLILDAKVGPVQTSPSIKKETSAVSNPTLTPMAAVEDDSVELENVPAEEADASIKNVLKHFPGTLKKEKKSS